MLTRESFLAAIKAAPDGDLPRIVFADWLDENGDVDRAEFIKCQCAVSSLPPNSPELLAANIMIKTLLTQQNIEKWLGEDGIPRELWGNWDQERKMYDGLSGFERGFPVLRYINRALDLESFSPEQIPDGLKQYFGVRAYIDVNVPADATGEFRVNLPEEHINLIGYNIVADGVSRITSITTSQNHKGNVAAYNCDQLTTINCPNGNVDARWCNSLTDINCSNGNVYAYICNTLTEINCPNGNVDANSCRSLATINCPNGNVDANSCRSLATINCPNGNMDARWCNSLTDINCPNGNVEARWCDNLTDINCHNGNVSINNCNQLTTINCHNGNVHAYRCNELSTIAISPERKANFILSDGCKNLKTLKIGDREIDLTKEKTARIEILDLIKAGNLPELKELNLDGILVIDQKTIAAARDSGRE